jgi:hypothetical protein
MVVGKRDGVNDTEAAGLNHGNEALRTSDPGERETGGAGEVREPESAANEIDASLWADITPELRLDLSGFVFSEEDRVGAA